MEKCPKRFEDKSQWGKTIPLPPVVRLPRLRRTVVQVEGREEVPDGPWKRTVVWLDDPAKDISIRVLDVQQQEPARYKVKVAAAVAFHSERERQQWKNGVKLVGISIQADAKIAADVTCDVKISFDTSKFPPDVLAEPKVALAAKPRIRLGASAELSPAGRPEWDEKGLLRSCCCEGESKLANQPSAKLRVASPDSGTDLLVEDQAARK